MSKPPGRRRHGGHDVHRLVRQCLQRDARPDGRRPGTPTTSSTSTIGAVEPASHSGGSAGGSHAHGPTMTTLSGQSLRGYSKGSEVRYKVSGGARKRSSACAQRPEAGLGADGVERVGASSSRPRRGPAGAAAGHGSGRVARVPGAGRGRTAARPGAQGQRVRAEGRPRPAPPSAAASAPQLFTSTRRRLVSPGRSPRAGRPRHAPRGRRTRGPRSAGRAGGCGRASPEA